MAPKNKSEKKEKCGTCSKVVTETDFAVMCEICSVWFHTKCQDVVDTVYKVLCQHDTLHWYCKQCSKGAEKVLGLISGLQAKADKLEKDWLS